LKPPNVKEIASLVQLKLTAQGRQSSGHRFRSSPGGQIQNGGSLDLPWQVKSAATVLIFRTLTLRNLESKERSL
jgi:hypothetical protein